MASRSLGGGRDAPLRCNRRGKKKGFANHQTLSLPGATQLHGCACSHAPTTAELHWKLQTRSSMRLSFPCRWPWQRFAVVYRAHRGGPTCEDPI